MVIGSFAIHLTRQKETNMKNKLPQIIILALIMLATPCWYASPASPEPVVIGVPLPLSGSLREFGIIMQNSFEMAKAAVNQAGGINGRPIELVFADDRGEVAAIKNVFNQLMVESKALMLVGGYASDPTYRLAAMAEKNDVPLLICTASADRITQRGWKNVFRLNPPISEYTKGLEDFWIKNYKPQSMAIIYENSMFGTNGALRMIEFCRDRAIEIRAHIDYDKTRANPAYFRSLLAPLTEEPPDVIYMVSYLEDAVALVKQIRELKINSLLCGGAGGFTLDEFIKRAGVAANYLVTATLWSEYVPFPGAKQYFRQYTEQYDRAPDYHGAEAYSALLVAADALKRTSSFSAKDIRRALNKTYLRTPFGPVKFYTYNDFERQNSFNTQVLQIVNGKFELIWPPELASSPFVLPVR
jgi:branched-chain amino acid transport system substrate-binding protein